ncbi:MAG TPA: nicotinate-nucleotide adenylyltransferase [Vicinamibacterales bacterium]|nr:nicotinate-nucleotide adenylyltransferase [Vicinamibacterales bacterium]
MSEGERIGVLGGTLDPIHVGHLDAALAAREALRLDRILVIPAHVPPHRARPSTSPFHRFAMAALAISGLDGFGVSDMELTAPGPSYTADTLLRLRAERGLEASQIFFITGADAFAEIETWSRYPDVLDLANFVAVARPGVSLTALRARLPHLRDRMRLPRLAGAASREPAIYLVDAPTTEVSSTEIRQRLLDGRSLSGLVPPAVEHHIVQHDLYGQRTTTPTAADHLHGQD